MARTKNNKSESENTMETLDKTEIQDTGFSSPAEPKIVEEIEIPTILKFMIDSSNKELQETQKRLMSQLNDSIEEVMDMMTLDRDDGWRIDLENQKFIKIK